MTSKHHIVDGHTMKIFSIAAVLVTFTASASHAISEKPNSMGMVTCATQAADRHHVPANILLAVMEGSAAQDGCQAYDQAALRVRHEIAAGRGDLWQRIDGPGGQKELIRKSDLWADKLGLFLAGGAPKDQPAMPADVQPLAVDTSPDAIDQAFEQAVPVPPGGSRVSVSVTVASAARSIAPAPSASTIQVGLQSRSPGEQTAPHGDSAR